MRLDELAISIGNAKAIFEKIKHRYPQIRAHLILSTRHSQATINSTLEHLLDETDFFVENEPIETVWKLLDEIWDLNESLRENRRYWPQSLVIQTEKKILKLQQKYSSLLPLIEIADDVEICLRWDEIDFEINRPLRSDQTLVDTTRTPQLGGIKICLGTVGNLAKKE